MNNHRFLRIAVSVVVAVAAVWYFQSREEAPDPSVADPAAPANVTAESADSAELGADSADLTADPAVTQPGMVAHIDPVTGKILETPPPEALPAESSSYSTDGLVEQPAPGGGMMVDLQGRFQHSAVATVGDSDSVKVECVPEAQDDKDSSGSGSDGGS